MNICFVCNEYPDGPHGGVGTMTQLLSEELVIRKHSVKVIGVYNTDYPSPKYEIKNGVEITRFKADYKSRFAMAFGYWSMAVKIRKWIKEGSVDIIETPDSYGMFSFFANFKRPLILRANGNNTYFSSILNTSIRKNTLFYEKHLYKKAFAICAVSSFTANRMKELYHINIPITVIFNAVELFDDENVQIIETENCNKILEIANPIIFSGTLTQKKGIYELVNATITLLKMDVIVTLIINGKDTINSKTGISVKEELLSLIPPDFTNYFVFNGHVTRYDLICQYKRSKAAIFPSFAEAFAFAPLEAMSAGVATIFSKECSGEELIIDKVDGLLIDPSSTESIIQAIKYIIQNPEKASQIARKGKEKVKSQFSKEIMTTKTIHFYEQVLHKFNLEKQG